MNASCSSFSNSLEGEELNSPDHFNNVVTFPSMSLTVLVCVLQTGSSLQQKVDGWTRETSATRELEANRRPSVSNSVSSEQKF